MGGKSSKAAAPAPAPMPQVETPSTDLAELAARRALDAKNGAVTASTTTESEDEMKPKTGGLGRTQQKPRRQKDMAAAMPTGGMNTSAILTG